MNFSFLIFFFFGRQIHKLEPTFVRNQVRVPVPMNNSITEEIGL